jgi:Fe2+ or Zn2+ uptake regulation protein
VLAENFPVLWRNSLYAADRRGALSAHRKKRGQLTRLCLDYIREHADRPISVADILPLAIGDRTLNAREQEILRTTVHQALHKIAKRGTIERMAGAGRLVRWQLPSEA